MKFELGNTAYDQRHFLPFAPLAEYLQGRFGDNKSDWARATGLDRSQIHKALRRPKACIQLGTADKACDALGLHPLELWADYHELAGAA